MSLTRRSRNQKGARRSFAWVPPPPEGLRRSRLRPSAHRRSRTIGDQLLTERFCDKIAGVLSCYDRIIIQGTIRDFRYAQAMTNYLYARHIRIFDYTQFAQPIREGLCDHAKYLADETGIEIRFIRKSGIRKAEIVHEIIKERGTHPGPVAILSAMEACSTYKSWHDETTGKTFMRPDDGKCLHYYFYFIDAHLELCHLRVPTWCPLRLQFYCNGHFWLVAELAKRRISYQLVDNAFTSIASFARAQEIANGLAVKALHRKLDAFVRRYCPAIADLGVTYHWSIDQAEYSTDIIFKRQADLRAIYDHLTAPPFMPSSPSRSQPSSVASSTHAIRTKWATASIRASRGHAGTRLSRHRSRSTTSMDLSCASKRRSTTLRSSSATDV